MKVSDVASVLVTLPQRATQVGRRGLSDLMRGDRAAADGGPLFDGKVKIGAVAEVSPPSEIGGAEVEGAAVGDASSTSSTAEVNATIAASRSPGIRRRPHRSQRAVPSPSRHAARATGLPGHSAATVNSSASRCAFSDACRSSRTPASSNRARSANPRLSNAPARHSSGIARSSSVPITSTASFSIAGSRATSKAKISLFARFTAGCQLVGPARRAGSPRRDSDSGQANVVGLCGDLTGEP